MAPVLIYYFSYLKAGVRRTISCQVTTLLIAPALRKVKTYHKKIEIGHTCIGILLVVACITTT